MTTARVLFVVLGYLALVAHGYRQGPSLRKPPSCRQVHVSDTGTAIARCNQPTEQVVSGGCNGLGTPLTTNMFSLTDYSLYVDRLEDLDGWVCEVEDPLATVEATVLCCGRDPPEVRPRCTIAKADEDGRVTCAGLRPRTQAIAGGCSSSTGLTFSTWLPQVSGWDCSQNSDVAEGLALCCDPFLPLSKTRQINTIFQRGFRQGPLIPQLFVKCTTKSVVGTEALCDTVTYGPNTQAISGSCYDSARDAISVSTWDSAGKMQGWQCDGVNPSTIVTSAVCCQRVIRF